MPLAYFVVRATVPDPAKRTAFDEWYRPEHLPLRRRRSALRKPGGSGASTMLRYTWRCTSSPIRPRSIAPRLAMR